MNFTVLGAGVYLVEIDKHLDHTCAQLMNTCCGEDETYIMLKGKTKYLYRRRSKAYT